MDGTNAFVSFDRLGQVINNFAKPNSPTLKCPATSESYGGSYRLKAGLITADELVLGGENIQLTTDSYLNPGNSFMYYYSMTPANFFDGTAFVWTGFPINDFVVRDTGVRPVINVTTDNGFTSGDGSSANPYLIS